MMLTNESSFQPSKGNSSHLLSSYHSNTKYPEDFFAKPRLFNRGKKSSIHDSSNPDYHDDMVDSGLVMSVSDHQDEYHQSNNLFNINSSDYNNESFTDAFKRKYDMSINEAEGKYKKKRLDNNNTKPQPPVSGPSHQLLSFVPNNHDTSQSSSNKVSHTYC
jgi:hypothetical protein